VLYMQDILKELSKFYMKNQFNINNLLNWNQHNSICPFQEANTDKAPKIWICLMWMKAQAIWVIGKHQAQVDLEPTWEDRMLTRHTKNQVMINIILIMIRIEIEWWWMNENSIE
jgi:hypothetical protein